MPKTLIALGGSIESLPILRKIKEMGHVLVVVDGNINAPGMALADVRVLASCYDPAETVSALHMAYIDRPPKLPNKTPLFDACLCAAIDAPHVAALVSSTFGLPGLSLEAAMLGADKHAQKMALWRNDIPVPSFFTIDRPGVVPGSDVVIKPLDSRGARGVIRLLPGVDPAWAYEQARAQSPSGRVMVEEWLDGPQLSTESLVQDGRVLFTAVGLRNYARLEELAPYVVEDGFDEPYDLEEAWVNSNKHLPLPGDLDALIEKSCAALGWFQKGEGVVKGDLVIHDGKLHVIELAPRLSGGLFCAAHELAYGVDFIGAAINMALGYTIDAPKAYPRQFVSQRYIFPRTEDIGKHIVAQPEVFKTDERFTIADRNMLPRREHKSIYSGMAHWSKPIGYIIQPVTAHPDRLGQALCVGATPQEARERAERAVKEMYNGMVIE